MSNQLDWFENWDPTPEELQRAVDAIPKERERIPVSFAARILDCSTQHVYNLIYDGTLPASNIARKPDSRPDYRVWTAGLRKFLTDRMEGAHV